MCLKRILIVEDDSDTRLAYHIIVKAKHCETFLRKILCPASGRPTDSNRI
jgi:hypothetical protein